MIRTLAIFATIVLLAGAVWRAAAAPAASERRPAACADAEIATARAAFKTDYDAGRFADAVSRLDDIWTTCVTERHWLAAELGGQISSDLALAHHRSGDDHACLEVLMDYWPANRAPPTAFRRLSPGLQRAMRFNWGLCRAACADGGSAYDAICQSMQVNDDMERRVRGFSRVACPLRPGASAVALPDGSCLAVLPPRLPFDVETALGARRAAVCPSIARITQAGGRTIATPLTAPPRSFLNSPEFCCQRAALTRNAAGQVAAEPGDELSAGCTSGHPAGVMQDIFELRNGRLVMVRQLNEPWFPQE